MEILQVITKITLQLVFILWVHRLLTNLVDWEKILKARLDNLHQINLLVLFLSIAIGHLVNLFFQDLIQLGFTIFLSMP